MRFDTKLDEAKAIGEFLLEIAKETIETINSATENRDKFAIGFLKYVEDTYTRQGDQYYLRAHGLTHVHRNITEILDNYKYFLEQANEKQGTQA